jgi:hypothetical protein
MTVAPNVAAGFSIVAGAAVLATLPTLDDVKADRVAKLPSEESAFDPFYRSQRPISFGFACKDQVI